MKPDDASDRSAWDDAVAALRLFAVDPAGLGGLSLRARAGPVRDAWLQNLRAARPPGAPLLRVPLGIADERLLGGLDLTETLRAGRPVAGAGLLTAAHDGVVLLAMAERLSAGTAARIGAVLDTGIVAVERDGFALRSPTRVAIVALDEGIEVDERPPAGLLDRLAFHLDLNHVSARAAEESVDLSGVAKARARLGAVTVPDGLVGALCAAGLAYGIASLRAPVLAVRAARAAAALAGRDVASDDDAALAARLVLAPRATRLPAAAPETSPEERPDADEGAPADADTESTEGETGIDDLVLAAVAAAISPDLLAQIGAGTLRRGGASAGSGAQSRDRKRGRPAGSVRGDLTRGARLNLVETLRAAAPWQGLRRREAGEGSRVLVRRDDLRVTRFKRRTETTTIFVVDASGSAAFHRLAEAKGAVELLLADCYVRRDRVALIAFRGAGADLLLPPTRSLTRAKRSLAALPGGGGTPLATAIDAAASLAETVARGGGSAVLVFLTDGRANVGRDGRGGREAAAADAKSAAARLRAGPAATLFIDTSPRPHEPAAAVAAAMGARYVPLPSADSRTLSGLVRREIASAS